MSQDRGSRKKGGKDAVILQSGGDAGKFAELREKIRDLLRLEGMERLEMLLQSEHPEALVQSLPDRDLYLTVRELGPIEALPLLSMASSSQIHHLVDLEAWRMNRLDPIRTGAWVATFLEAGEETMDRFIQDADDELLSALFLHWARLKPVEYDDQVPVAGIGETETGDERGFISPDGYYRFNPEIQAHAPAVRRLAELLLAADPERYRQILWDACWQVPSELEDSALHWRQSRMEEYGYLSLEEAQEIYQPPRGLAVVPEETAIDPDRGAPLPSQVPAAVLAEDPTWLLLERDMDPQDRDRVFLELSALANRVLVADQMDTGLPDSHRSAIRKAGAYVAVALAARRAAAGGRAAGVLAQVPMIELFREGYALAEDLRNRCVRLLETSWPASHADSLELLDPPLRQRLAGLMHRHPLYYEIEASPDADRKSSADSSEESAPKEPFRDFRALAEIRETANALDLVEHIGSVLVDRMGLDISRLLADSDDLPLGGPRFSTLLLTMMAWHAARGELRLEPLPADVAADFLRTVASRRTADDQAPTRALDSLVATLTTRLDLSSPEIAAMKGYGLASLASLAEECASLDPGAPMSRRSISCLLLERKES